MDFGNGQREQLCPRKEAASVAEAFRGWRLLRDHGILPVAGGWLDQTAAFVAAVDVIDGELYGG